MASKSVKEWESGLRKKRSEGRCWEEMMEVTGDGDCARSAIVRDDMT